MTIAVDLGRKATKQRETEKYRLVCALLEKHYFSG